MKKKIYCISIIFTFLFTLQNAFSEMKNPKNILKVKLFQSGKILIDEKSVSLEELDHELSGINQKEGAVWYYRESGTTEPPAIATHVIDLVMKHKLPISLSSKPDFSDYVDEKGSHPRVQ